MNEFKSWLQSKTIWMALVAIAPIVSKYIGFDVEATMNDLVTVVGCIGVIWFRITAKQVLKFK